MVLFRFGRDVSSSAMVRRSPPGRYSAQNPVPLVFPIVFLALGPIAYFLFVINVESTYSVVLRADIPRLSRLLMQRIGCTDLTAWPN